MTKNNRPIISDPYIEIPGTTMEERLDKYHEDKMEYSRIREEERLNAPIFIFSGIDTFDQNKDV
ncbi:MAG: hypothetical protein J6S12_02695, partial [Alphaproteobacteria bacterium]|nr:hypothetical protein [Alphaproteobacteria bacterium]